MTNEELVLWGIGTPAVLIAVYIVGKAILTHLSRKAEQAQRDRRAAFLRAEEREAERRRENTRRVTAQASAPRAKLERSKTPEVKKEYRVQNDNGDWVYWYLLQNADGSVCHVRCGSPVTNFDNVIREPGGLPSHVRIMGHEVIRTGDEDDRKPHASTFDPHHHFHIERSVDDAPWSARVHDTHDHGSFSSPSHSSYDSHSSHASHSSHSDSSSSSDSGGGGGDGGGGGGD